MAEEFQKTMWEEAETLLMQPSEKRDTKKLKSILVWFRQRSPIFKTLEEDTMMDILRNVKLCRYRRDSIIVRKGDKGQCLFVILKGSVSVYAKKEGEGEISQEATVRSHKERLVLFGTELATLKAGRSFGESVMIEEDSERNATVISDEATVFITIDKQLYKRSLMETSVEWKNKTDFVTQCSLFDTWPHAYKSLLVENLTAHKFNFGNVVVKQGTPCQSVFFIAKGMGKVVVDPCIAAKQYKSAISMMPKKVEASKQESLKFEDDEDDIACMALTVIEKRRRRLLFGYVAEERRQRARSLHVAVIGENDIIGDLEMVLDLSAYSASVECLESLECYELDKPSFNRLIVKRNPETLAMIRQVAIAKLEFRSERLSHVPYYGLLMENALQDVMSSSTAKRDSIRPKSVAKALVGFMKGKRMSNPNDFFKRLAQSNAQNDKNAATAAIADDGRQSDTRENQDRRRDKKDNKKQYTPEEFRALKKKVQSTGKLIGKISD